MSALKKLSSDDLECISYDFGEILEREVSNVISVKELEDIDLNISVDYDGNQLDVDVDLSVDFDELSAINQELLSEAIDNAYLIFDSYIDNNYRV